MSKRLGTVLYHPLTAFEDDVDDAGEQLTHSNGSSTSSLNYSPKVLYKLSFRALAVVTAALPLFGFVFCLFWSIFMQFQLTTATHCNVPNILPSLSAATGSFYPQRYVWKLTISLHTVPRIIVFVIYFCKHNNLIIFVLNLMEIFSLLGLALFGSNDNYSVHSKCFATFLISSIIYMFFVSYCGSTFGWCRKTQPIKKIIAWMTLLLSASATYFFYRHNNYCEPYVYSLFAFSEYTIVLGNIYFHFMAYYDLSNVSFAILSSQDPDDKEGSTTSLA